LKDRIKEGEFACFCEVQGEGKNIIHPVEYFSSLNLKIQIEAKLRGPFNYRPQDQKAISRGLSHRDLGWG